MLASFRFQGLVGMHNSFDSTTVEGGIKKQRGKNGWEWGSLSKLQNSRY